MPFRGICLGSIWAALPAPFGIQCCAAGAQRVVLKCLIPQVEEAVFEELSGLLKLEPADIKKQLQGAEVLSYTVSIDFLDTLATRGC